MIIVDTGFFVALGSRGDNFHRQAVEVLNSIQDCLITTYPVITETSYLLMQRQEIQAQHCFIRNVIQGGVQVFSLDRNHLARMLDLMVRYADLPMDLADASLVVLAEQLQEGRILTTDRRDFSIYRWNNTQYFINLLES
ncbi:MAG: type II toxin-antitoxin system VapC family toxin [Prochlorothrix sp.]